MSSITRRSLKVKLAAALFGLVVVAGGVTSQPARADWQTANAPFTDSVSGGLPGSNGQAQPPVQTQPAPQPQITQPADPRIQHVWQVQTFQMEPVRTYAVDMHAGMVTQELQLRGYWARMYSYYYRNQQGQLAIGYAVESGSWKMVEQTGNAQQAYQMLLNRRRVGEQVKVTHYYRTTQSWYGNTPSAWYSNVENW